MFKLNLGCCDNLLTDYTNVDKFDFSAQAANRGAAFMQADLAKSWPWDTSTVDEVRAPDIFEHMHNKIHSMNEAHRVLRPGGILDLIVPTTDGRGAFQDPTHVSFWTPNDLFYFCEHWLEWQRFRRPYGITAQFRVCGSIPGYDGKDQAWSLINDGALDGRYSGHRENGYNKVWKLHVQLEAIK